TRIGLAEHDALNQLRFAEDDVTKTPKRMVAALGGGKCKWSIFHVVNQWERAAGAGFQRFADEVDRFHTVGPLELEAGNRQFVALTIARLSVPRTVPKCHPRSTDLVCCIRASVLPSWLRKSS